MMALSLLSGHHRVTHPEDLVGSQIVVETAEALRTRLGTPVNPDQGQEPEARTMM